MKVKTNTEFSGVPKGTTGEAEVDGHLLKVTWDLGNKVFADWFDADETLRYLQILTEEPINRITEQDKLDVYLQDLEYRIKKLEDFANTSWKEVHD